MLFILDVSRTRNVYTSRHVGAVSCGPTPGASRQIQDSTRRRGVVWTHSRPHAQIKDSPYRSNTHTQGKPVNRPCKTCTEHSRVGPRGRKGRWYSKTPWETRPPKRRHRCRSGSCRHSEATHRSHNRGSGCPGPWDYPPLQPGPGPDSGRPDGRVGPSSRRPKCPTRTQEK